MALTDLSCADVSDVPLKILTHPKVSLIYNDARMFCI